MMPALFSIHRTPFTFNVQRTCRRPSRIKGASSSVVTIHGPSELAESFPLAGPRRASISSRWRSRQLQSLKMVKPAMCEKASDSATLRASLPMTAASSSS